MSVILLVGFETYVLNVKWQEAAETENGSPSRPAKEKKRARAMKEVDREDGDEPAPKKAKAATKKDKKAKTENDFDKEPKPKKDREKPTKSKVKDESGPVIKAEADDEHAISTPPKKQRAPRKAAHKKIKSEESDLEDGEPTLTPKGDDEGVEEDEESAEEIPKARKGRKPAVKKDKDAAVATSKPATKPRRKVILDVNLHR